MSTTDTTIRDRQIADLDYATRIAREGAHTPLLGGPIGLLWGVLIAAATLLQYLILEQVLAVPLYTLGFLWIAFAVVGGLGSWLLGRRIEAAPGANSTANRVEGYVWTLFAAMLGALVAGILLDQLIGGGGARLWDFIIPATFAGQGLAYGVVAKLSGLRWLHLASFAGFVFGAATVTAVGENIIYLIASVGAVLTVVLPSLRTMKAAG